FLTADQIAEMNGLSKTSSERIQAAIIYALQQSSLDGHVYLPEEQCVARTLQVLQVETLTEEDVQEKVDEQAELKRGVKEEANIYLPSLYYAEDQFARHVERRLNKRVDLEVTDAELMRYIGELAAEESLNYGEEQFYAIL